MGKALYIAEKPSVAQEFVRRASDHNELPGSL